MGSFFARVVARLRAITSGDWRGPAGGKFRATVAEVGEFSREHGLGASDLADHAQAAISGASNEKLAKAIHDYAQAEQASIQNALLFRSLESDLKKKDAEAEHACYDADRAKEDARKAKAEADMAEIVAMDAKLNLLRRLQDLGVTLVRDDQGNTVVVPAIPGLDLTQLGMSTSGEKSLSAPENQPQNDG